MGLLTYNINKAKNSIISRPWEEKTFLQKAGATLRETDNTILGHLKKTGEALDTGVGFDATKPWEEMSAWEKTKAMAQEAPATITRPVLSAGLKIGSMATGLGQLGVQVNPAFTSGQKDAKQKALKTWGDMSSSIEKYQNEHAQGLAPGSYKEDDNVFQNPGLLKNPEYLLRVATEQVPNMAMMIATGGLGEGLLELGSAYDERTKKNRESNKSPDAKDVIYAGTIGVINGILGKIGFDKLFKTNPILKETIGKKIQSVVNKTISSVVGTGTEMTTEYIQESIPLIASKIFYDEGGTWSDVLATAHKQGLSAAGAAGIIAGPISAVNAVTPVIATPGVIAEEEKGEPNETAKERLSNIVQALPKNTTPVLTQAVFKPITAEILQQLTPEESQVIGIALTAAKELPGADVKTIENNLQMIESAGVKIPVAQKSASTDQTMQPTPETTQKPVEKTPVEKPVLPAEKPVTKKEMDSFDEIINKAVASKEKELMSRGAVAKEPISQPQGISKSETIQGEEINQIFIRPPKKSEVKNPSATKNFATIPDKPGWEKVFKAYGEQGRGFYYIQKTKVKKEKPVKAKPIPEKIMNSQAGAEIYQQFETAKAGERFAVEADQQGGTMEWQGIKSTFPSWVPKEYRTRKLFDVIQKSMIEGKVPKGKKAQELYEIVREKIKKQQKFQAKNSKEQRINNVTVLAIQDLLLNPRAVANTFQEKLLMPDGREAWGMQLREVIGYSNNPLESTPSHESIHFIVENFLSEKERSNLFAAIRSRPGMSRASALEVEETIALEFPKFVKKYITLKKGKATVSLKNKVLLLFQKIWLRIREMAGFHNKVKKLYLDAISGKYRTLTGVNKQLGFSYNINFKDKEIRGGLTGAVSWEIGMGDYADMVARERFDIPNLNKLNFGGSDRDVYSIGKNKVLKVAKTARGLDQNNSSSDWYAEQQGLIPKTFEVGKNYVVKELVGPPDAKTKKMVSDLKKLTNLNSGGFYNRDDYYKEVQQAVEIMDKAGYNGSGVLDYGDVLWGDMQVIRNWGTDKDGNPMLLDEGTLNGKLVSNAMKSSTGGTRNLMDPQFRDIYYQSRAAKKKFGDTDIKTKYQAKNPLSEKQIKDVLKPIDASTKEFTAKGNVVSAEKIFQSAWRKLYGEDSPRTLADLLNRPADVEVILKGNKLSFVAGKEVQRAKSQAEKNELRENNAVKVKKVRSELKKMFKDKTAKGQEIKAKVIEYVKANIPKNKQGNYLVAVKNAKTEKNLAKIIDAVDKKRAQFERSILVNSINNVAENIKNLPVDLQRTIIKITSEIELKKHTKKLLGRLQRSQEYLDKQANDFEMPRRVLNQLGILKRTPFESLSTNQLIAINNRLQQYNLVGRNIMRDKAVLAKKGLEDTLAGIEKGSVNLDIIDPARKLNPFEEESITGSEKFKDRMSRLQMNLIGTDRLFNKLDNRADYTGPNYRLFKEPVNEKWNVWQYDEDRIKMIFYKMLNELKMTDDNSKRIAIYAYSQQRGGRKKLLEDHGMTDKQIDSVKLDEKEMAVYNFMRRELDGLHEKMTVKMEKENNTTLGKQENYFPMMTNYGVTKPLLEEMEEMGRMKSVVFGAIKERKENAHQVLKMDAFQVFDSYVGKSTYFIAMDSTLQNLNKIASSERYRKAVGENAQRSVLTWLDVMARKGGAVKKEKKWEEKLNDYNNKLSVVVLGLRITTMAKQPLALLDGAGEIGSYAFAGTKMIIEEDWRMFINENSSEMRNRAGGDPAFEEIAHNKFLPTIQDKAMLPIKFLDRYTAGAVWAGAYTKKMDELGLKVDFRNPNKESLKYADLVVRKTQASGSFKDLPLAMVNEYRTASKLIFKFQTFILNRWSYLSEDLPDKMKNNKKLAVQQLAFLSLSALLESGVSSLYYGMMTGGDDDEESRASKTVKAILSSYIQTVPFLGQLFASLNYGSNPVPLIEFGNKFFDSLKQVKDAKRTTTKTKHAIRVMSYAAGLYYGLPTEQARSLIEKWLFSSDKKSRPSI